jgi:hypothetical protein
LNPKVRQSGNSAPVHGRISKAGRAQVRGVLVEAAWSASRAPGPLRAFFHRIKARRGFQNAVVATARKMTVLAWHLITKDQDYAFARPALVTHKRRKLELAAGAPSQRENHGQPGAAYNDKQRRNEEKTPKTPLARQTLEPASRRLGIGWRLSRYGMGLGCRRTDTVSGANENRATSGANLANR